MNTRPVLASSVIVRAPRAVGTVCTRLYASGESSCRIVSVPSTLDVKTYPLAASKASPSGSSPISGVATRAPVSLSTTASLPLPPAEKSRCVALSIASPVPPSTGAIGQAARGLSVRVSTTWIMLLSSVLTKRRPLPSKAMPSSFPSIDTVAVISPVAGSMGKTLKEQMRFSIAYWHSFRGVGADPFGPGTIVRPWEKGKDPVSIAKVRMDAAFEFFTENPGAVLCFHDRDIAPEGRTLAESNRNLDKIVATPRACRNRPA
jgi:hypothetical protein